MKIYLIRHGQTVANARHLYCGRTDLPLSAAGIRELRGRKYRLDGVKFVISGMKRTKETLDILFPGVAYTVEPGFREIDFGIFEMHSYAQLKDTPEYRRWLEGDNEGNVPPGGESGYQMTARVLEAYRQIREDTAIITHGGVIAAIMQAQFPEEGKNRYEWQPKPGCGYLIEDGQYCPLE